MSATRGAGPVITIRYCVDCRWLLRAQWYAGELLQTFADEVGGVLVAPASGAMFRIDVDGPDGPRTVWNRKTDGGFPEIGELKRRVRDLVAPEKPLGHTDRAAE
ncbi:SelT/SelW/SelH family protein [Nocardioides sambongensis]|uniref:SelT/SelW/SelH family protein n=1 Tax=Nocardioides sambongensis TaxID=2589074 RepID=UPI00112D2CBE|nr:SelT/SelW/SelH family protein [Nocardioides sambongensis]